MHHMLVTEGVAHFDQGALPICTAVAAVSLVNLLYVSLGKITTPHSPAYTYLAGERLVFEKEAVSIESQTEGGLPLAACVEAVCLYGVIPRKAVPFPDNPEALKRWMTSKGLTLDDVRSASADLQLNFRPLRLFPSEENIKAAIVGSKPVAFSFRIDALLDQWMRSAMLQAGSRFRIPPTGNFGKRIATHAAVIVGFDDMEGAFRVRNSFGPRWGLGGDFWVAYGTLLRTSFSSGEFYILGS